MKSTFGFALATGLVLVSTAASAQMRDSNAAYIPPARTSAPSAPMAAPVPPPPPSTIVATSPNMAPPPVGAAQTRVTAPVPPPPPGAQPAIDPDTLGTNGIAGLSPEDFFYRADVRQTGLITFSEYYRMVGSKYSPGDIEPSKRFAAMDDNGDRRLSKDEIVRNYNKPYEGSRTIHWVPNGFERD